MRMPANPISANCFHSTREKPVSSRESRSLRRCDIGAFFARKPRALSRRRPCLSFKTSGMLKASGARQIDDALGDDVELHLAGATLDRIRLGAEPRAGERALLRARAFTLKRARAARGHQYLMRALVQFGAVIFQHRGKGGVRLPALREIARPLKR